MRTFALNLTPSLDAAELIISDWAMITGSHQHAGRSDDATVRKISMVQRHRQLGSNQQRAALCHMAST